MIGTADFLSAWRKGIEEFRALDGDVENRNFIRAREAQEIYRPVGLRETDLGLQYGSTQAIVAGFENSMSKLVDRIIEDYLAIAKKSGNKRDYNKLGIACAQFSRYAQAEKAFNTSLSLDRNYLSAKVNLGNIYYLQDEFQEALQRFHSAEENLLGRKRTKSSLYAKVLLNISKSYYELENYDKATVYFDRALIAEPAYGQQFGYLRSSEGSGTRSADIGAPQSVLFTEEEL